MTEACDAALNALSGDKAEGRVFRKTNGKAWGSIRHAWDNAVKAAKLSTPTCPRRTSERLWISWPA